MLPALGKGLQRQEKNTVRSNDALQKKSAHRHGRGIQMENQWLNACSRQDAAMRPILQPALRLLIEKNKRLLTLYAGEDILLRCPVALGRCPVGRKRQEGDGRTPEGVYTICLVKEQGKYGRSLGLSYPNRQDADDALRDGRIDLSTHQVILDRLAAGQRPPWGSPLGGEVYIHEGGTASDWTQGCIALESKDMDVLFPRRDEVCQVEILP